ncbi:hypothetical protein [Candidatus Tisiphia endosymbiont of Hybos culiciformis]
MYGQRHCEKTVGRRSNCKLSFLHSLSFPRRRESRSLPTQG